MPPSPVNMSFTPAPTLISTVVSLFQKRAAQPTFTPAVPPVPTQVYVTRTTTTHVDPPALPDSTSHPSASSALDKMQTQTQAQAQKDRPLSLHVVVAEISEKKQQRQQHHCHLYPDTLRAPDPRRTTFVLPLHDCNTADDDRSSVCEVDLPGNSVRYPAEHAVCAVVEPKTLARALFFFGFVFPAFWMAGSLIMWIPLRTTRDWEAGKNSMEIKWGCSVIRETELRWARRCLVALVSEVLLVVLIVVIVKWGVMAHA